MKSLKELEEIKQRTLDSVNLRKERTGGTRVVVGMATCGIAAGARPVLLAFLEEVKREISVTLPHPDGLHGVCRLVHGRGYPPGRGKVTYVKMTADKVKRAVAEHIVNGHVVTDIRSVPQSQI